MGLVLPGHDRNFVKRWTMLLVRPVLDTIYPPACAACGIRTRRHYALCPNCWRDMRFIERPYCEVLGIPFRRDQGEGIVSAQAIAEPPPVPLTAIISRDDGIIEWEAARSEPGSRVDVVEVSGAHMSICTNPQVQRIIAERLARL